MASQHVDPLPDCLRSSKARGGAAVVGQMPETRGRRLRRRAHAILVRVPLRPVLAAACVVLLAAPPALADGGRTIATAPRAGWDVHYTGTTVDVGAPCPTRLGSYFSYWTLRVTQGDRVTIDWGAQQQQTVLSLLPVGTTDATAATATPTDTQQLDEMYGKSELTAEPQRHTGVVPLQIHGSVCDGGGGPYDFAAHVRHAVRLSFRPPRRVRTHARLTVRVHAPDGHPITSRRLRVSLQAFLRGVWRPAGHAAPSRGHAYVRLALRPRRHVRLRAVASGAGWVRRVSAVRRARVVS
jgi:hypothetical protein